MLQGLKAVATPVETKSTAEKPVDRLDDIHRLVWANIQGWVGDRIHHILRFVREYHDAENIRGNIAEIGVHHGKLFFLLAAIARSDEQCIAIDLYEDQEKNLDKSGNGSLAIFTSHLNGHFPQLKSQVRAVQADSMALTPAGVRARLGIDNARLFSVDGGHTVAHVVNDLEIAQELIVPGGVILLDDFLGPLWPSVTEGYFRYVQTANRKLAPFLIFQNKLFLTTYSEHPVVLARLRVYLDNLVGAEIHSRRWRYAMLGEHKVLCFA